MVKIVCPELNYLEAKLKRLKWTEEQDSMLVQFVAVDPTILVAEFNQFRVTARAVMRRQRELGVREFTNKRTWRRI